MGRAPTSGNCHTCRMRRVKCDRARPACERCIKAGFECKGYETVLRMQSHSFVADAQTGTVKFSTIQTVSSFPEAKPGETPLYCPKGKRQQQQQQKQQPQQQQQQQQLVRANKVAARRTQSPSPKSASSASRSRSSGNDTGSDGGSNSGTARSSPPPELSLEGFVDEITFSYFFHSYGWINMHSIMLQDSRVRDTLLEGMGHDSLRALAYGVMGKDQHIGSLQSKGARLYGTALGKLRKKMSSQSKDELAALIKPIAIMGSYLITVENDLRFTHHRGLSRILEYCGPEYFQSASLLPVFDSCRLTMISNSIVRRTPTFLSQDKWKTIPWEKAPHLKTWSSRLLDIMADIPELISGVLGVMGARIMWQNSNFSPVYAEDPNEVPRLQGKVHDLKLNLANWLQNWTESHPTAHKVMEWAFNRAAHDEYRPGFEGYSGPDVYDYSVLLPPSPPPFLEPTEETFILMQEVSLYTTVLIWTGRLTKYLAGASIGHDNINFYNTPFSTTCTCCTSRLKNLCDTVPDSHADVLQVTVAPDPEMQWNFNAARIAIAPIKVSHSHEKPQPVPDFCWAAEKYASDSAEMERLRQQKEQEEERKKAQNARAKEVKSFNRPLPVLSSPNGELKTPPLSSPVESKHNIKSGSPGITDNLPTPPQSAVFNDSSFTPPQSAKSAKPPMLLPADVRFSSQLRVLDWLTDHLPASRPHVLATLASIGLGHCGHDVRPIDGLPEVGSVVRRVLHSTQFEGSENVLLKRYR
ncbi:uncharacterized protein PgNI_01272 [Pyricularia grisea]|uniref:Zn(2)-C6 fungal-type domain-containing protein n=1 Tax=Pyricularia grisea TaxID=148305 RepID=A0A6P8BIN8_PYRGI|nr:uncharacterized protein PgNI_01272 [Pyricularia grisea]TLD16504.1 hypothetical protein PgNI_01272 [Pyricularia grisea]